jgi:transposase
MIHDELIIGIDASLHLDGSDGGDRNFCLPNTPEGVDAIVSWLKQLGPGLVVLEATREGYEVPLAKLLAAVEIAVVVVNPRHIREFARTAGLMAETDIINAQILVDFGRALHPSFESSFEFAPVNELSLWSGQNISIEACV